jgi:hypothetical protein
MLTPLPEVSVRALPPVLDIVAPATWVMLFVEVKLTPAPNIAPATFNVSVVPVRVTCSEPALDPPAFKLTVALLAVSVMAIFPLADALRAVALVLLTVIGPLPPVNMRLPVLSAPPVEETPVAPLRVIEPPALKPPAPLKLILPPVETKVMKGAVTPTVPESVMLLLAVMETLPNPAVA